METRADILDLYEDAPCGFMSVSPDGKIVRINHTLTEWLGLTAVDLLDSSLLALLNPGGRIAYETHIRPLLRMQGHVNELSLDFLNSEGSRVPFIANIAERRDAEGVLISTRFALFLANDRRLYEKTLLAAREAAETVAQTEKQTSLLREQFITVLGHDLRNPLTAILSGINVLKRSKTLNERENQILQSMNASAWRAEHLISDVLDFARGRMGDGIRLQPSLNDNLSMVLSQVIDEIKMTSPDQTFKVDLSINDPVFCDGGRIGQLLSNLLSNAIKHGDRTREIHVSAETDDQNFTLRVENFGEPIEETVQKNLFQPFFRGEMREDREGLGLGLFIVSEIAKAHGGTVDVTSNESTVFRLKMPLNAQT